MVKKSLVLVACLLATGAMHAAEQTALVVATRAVIDQGGCTVTFYDEEHAELGVMTRKAIIGKGLITSSSPTAQRFRQEVVRTLKVDASQLRKKDITIQNEVVKCVVL